MNVSFLLQVAYLSPLLRLIEFASYLTSWCNYLKHIVIFSYDMISLLILHVIDIILHLYTEDYINVQYVYFSLEVSLLMCDWHSEIFAGL